MVSMMLTPLTPHIPTTNCVHCATRAVSCSHFIFQMYKCAHIFIKVKVKIKFTLEQVTKTQKGCRGIALLFL